MMPNRIITGDCVAELADLPECSADLIFADPPFNTGHDYDIYRDRIPRSLYLAWTDQWLSAAVRVLKPSGSIFVAINAELCGYLQVRLDAMGLAFRNSIIWSYRFGTHQKAKFSRDHTPILYYVRDPKHFTFNADDVRVESERQRLGDKRANPRGRVPGDIWNFPRVCGTFRERTGHPCQMPGALLERIILAASNPGDLVLDPFAGSGTTLVLAQKLGRRFLGVELSPAYAEGVRKRLEESATLRTSSTFATPSPSSLPVAG